jgi:hypothetical protein
VASPSRAPALPTDIAGIVVPQDLVSAATWARAHRTLPAYLRAHSIRSYCWGMVIGAREGWTIDARILWSAALLHDAGLTTLTRNRDCFEVSGGAMARRFLARTGMDRADARDVERAIVLHMAPTVTLEDGVEAVLLDRATGLDVRGAGFELVDAVRPAVVRAYPRGSFDRRFLQAMTREAEARPTCHSARLVHRVGLAERMARSPWAAD